MPRNEPVSPQRVVLVAIAVGLLFAVILILSREVFGGRSLPFWLENTAGVWFLAAFASGYLARGAIPGAFAGFGALLLALFLYESISLTTADGLSIRFSPLIREVWVGASVVAGAVFGFLGGWATEDRWDRWFGASVLGGLMVGEAVALFVEGPPHPAFDTGMAAVQIFAGTGVMLLGARGRPSWPAIGVFLAVSLAVILLELSAGLITRFVWG